MIQIPAGSFEMGAQAQESNETPVHRVEVAAFELDRTEVTVTAYRTCVKAGKCTEPGAGYLCNWDKSERERHPINCIDWEQAKAYCEWAGKRLPTEEEWEYAARGKNGQKYPWGDKEPEQQLCWNKTDGTCEAGSYLGDRSPFGALDMGGNVKEWTGSLYSSDYKQPRDGPQRLVRGGAWYINQAPYLRASYRSNTDPSAKAAHLGVRCAK